MFMRFALLATVLTLGFAGPAAADTAALDKLKANRLAITLDQGKLAGPGAAALLQASRQAQYVLLGEDHGVAEIARFSSAYFNVLAPAGFTTLVTENGPVAASVLEAMLKRADAVTAIARFDAAYPDTIAFYTMRQEAEMLAGFAQAAGPRFEQWGIDQEFIGTAKYLIARMLAQPVNPAARAKLEALRQMEAVAYQKAAATGNPMEHLMLSASDEELASLRPLLAGPKEQTALGLLDALLESRAIYQKSASKVPGDRDLSNHMRLALLKRTLGSRLGAREQKLVADAGATDGSWSLFDLRSLRPGSRELAAGDIDMFNLINGYDFALIIPEGSASTQLAAP